jgi:hypothetical protein
MLGFGRVQSLGICNRDSMTFFFAHRVDGAPIGFWRLVRIELKSRGIAFFDVAPTRSTADKEHPPLDRPDRVEAKTAMSLRSSNSMIQASYT